MFTVKLKVVPAGGFTRPTAHNKVAELLNPDKEKSPGSWLAVFKAKLTGVGANTLGNASK